MKRRWRLPRRSELRRAAVARLVRDYRMLVIAATATTPGEPEDVASAIEATYEAVQRSHRWTARRMRAAEVRRLSDGSFAFAAELGVKSLDLQRPAVLEHRRELNDLFTVTLGTRWNAALDDLRILHEVAWEAGRTFHDAAAGNPLHEVLARLHARGLAVVGEILCLLEHGFASGAMARWRTLHEATVVAAVVGSGGEQPARRYLDHDAVSRWRQVQEYQRRAGDLGFDPIEPDVLAGIRERHDGMLTRYGKGFREAYGWANEEGDSRRLTFRDLEALAGQDHLRPYYQMANHPIHAGAQGLLWEIGAVDDRVLVTGPSDRGLADPGQLTAFSLAGLTRTFVLSRHDVGLRWIIYVDALDTLSRRTSAAFLRVHESADAEPGTLGLVSAGDPDAPSLLAWPKLEHDHYAQLLTRTVRRMERGARRRHRASGSRQRRQRMARRPR